MGKRETRAVHRTGSKVHLILFLILFHIFFSPQTMALPVGHAREYLHAVRTSPAQIEIAALPNGCSEDRLTMFRQNGKILRVQYDTYDGCATEQSFQIDQLFDSAGLPVYATFRDCPGKQDGCIAGQIYFSKQKIARTENFKIVIQLDKYGRYIKSTTATKEGISLCADNDINRPSGKSCYFMSSSDVERYLKSRIANKNLEEMSAIVTTGTFSEALLSASGEWETRINANQVRLREEPSTTAPVLEHLFPFETAVVIERGIEEQIIPWGTYHWYKVKAAGKTGWVFGTFLDPVLNESMLETAQHTRWLSSLSGESPRRLTYSPSFSPERVVCSTSEIDSSVTCTLRLTYAVATKTNLNEAYLLISSGPLNRSCEMEDFRDGFPASEEKTITENGVEYRVSEMEEGGMSKLYYRKVYLTYQNHRCRAVIYFYHTTNREVYVNGNDLLEFDRTKALIEFDRVRRSILWE